jgi:hypothetical protein
VDAGAAILLDVSSPPRPATDERVRVERALARQEREQAALDLHEAYLYGGPLEHERRQRAEQHLAAARQHERTADEIERAATPRG